MWIFMKYFLLPLVVLIFGCALPTIAMSIELLYIRTKCLLFKHKEVVWTLPLLANGTVKKLKYCKWCGTYLGESL